jgi:hypothetical protein
MALQTEPVAHNNLVSGGQTTLHSHAGGGGGADVKAGNETGITENTTRAVTFTTSFSATPNVVVGFSDNSAEISVVSAHTVSTTGFTILVTKSGGGGSANRDVAWVATDAGNP